MHLSNKPLITRDQIQSRIDELAKEISDDYAARELLAVIILKGGSFFGADLLRRLTVPIEIDFVRARSYKGKHSRGMVEFSFFPTTPLEGKHILLVEDILDTGRTTSAIFDRFEMAGPASIKLCSLLDKPDNRKIEVAAGYVGFTIEDFFVVGYGLDYDERYRELNEVYILEDV